MKRIIMGTFLLISVLTLKAQNTNGDNLFDDSFLHEFRFENVDMDVFTETKHYQQLKMFVDDNEVDSVGFKRKGNISAYYNPDKLAIKIKTNKYVSGKKYDGTKEFTLHMNYQDPSMLREKLTYDLCKEMGLYSLRTAFAKVYINDEYWGLYTLVEGKDEMYKQIFDTRDMDAIESLDFGDMCFISNNPSDYDYDNNGGNPTYVLENGEAETAWPRFAKMIDKANNTNDIEYMDTVARYLNLEDFFKYQAINVYLMNMDSYIDFRGNQIYIYDTTVNQWQVQPWDFNASFGLWNTNNYSPNSYPMIPNSISGGCIAGKMNSIDPLRTYYLNAMCQLNSILGDTISYFEKIDYWKNQIQQAVYDDTRKHITNMDFDKCLEYGNLDLFGENIPSLKSFIKERNDMIEQGIAEENYNCNSIGIDELKERLSINIYPNPAKDFISFHTKTNRLEQYEVSIFNNLGQLVLNKSSQIKKINIAHLEKGFYIIRIQNQDQSFTSKFIKE